MGRVTSVPLSLLINWREAGSQEKEQELVPEGLCFSDGSGVIEKTVPG